MNDFYVYILRRPDKIDPEDPELGMPFYVGKGANGRIDEHRRTAKNLLGRSGRKVYKINVIHSLWSRGLDFVEEVMESGLSEQAAFTLERELIKKYGRVDNRTGILANSTDGGEGASSPSIKTLQKRAKSREGYRHTPETIEKIRQANTGYKHTPEAIEKMKQALKGRAPWHKGKTGVYSSKTIEHWSKVRKGIPAPWNLGKTHSLETREKIGAASRGKKHTEEFKQHLSALNKGKTLTEEHKKKISKSLMGHPGAKKGEKRSKATRDKLSQTLMGHEVSEETRKKISASVKRYWEQKTNASSNNRG
jgi:hypothetical protein